MKPRATTDCAILGMLTLRPMSGYDIRAAIAENIAYFWTESYGQIYPTLKRLVKEKLVTRRSEQSGKRARHVYAVTPAGQAALAEWLRQAPTERPPRSELLLKLFFGRQVEAAEAGRHLERFRQAQMVARAQYEVVERQLYEEHGGDPDLLYWLIALRYGQLETEAHARWAEEALQILAELQAPAAKAN
jgi:DNA-binding PadR family transcriptional regulator